MKAFLMHADRDFDLKAAPPSQHQDLVQDLELETLFDAMAGGDPFLREVARTTVLASLPEVGGIRYRQAILQDCLGNPTIVRNIYSLAVEALARERKLWGAGSARPGFLLYRSVEVLHLLVEMLRRLRRETDAHAHKFSSDGLQRFFAMLQRELDDECFAIFGAHLARLKFRHGVLISAELGEGTKGTAYILRKPNEDHRGWIERLFTRGPPAHSFRLHERDEAGARALSELCDRGINTVANAVAQSSDHILSFFGMLRTELAFYVGCLNLYDRLSAKGEPTCFPVPAPCAERRNAARGLYDLCLALRIDRTVVGNDIDADSDALFVVTGANQGGKSTFLRSVGVAQLMMQAGMFVPARSFSANLCAGLFTHYKREEDAAMKSGKFEEELRRMSGIADHLSANCMVLLNESFQATNEREGSEIGRQIIEALIESRIKVFCVTHLYDLARSLHDGKFDNAIFLRAERLKDGTRTFKIVPAAPQPTSHGRDLYDQIFAADARFSSARDGDAVRSGRERAGQKEVAGQDEAGGAAP